MKKIYWQQGQKFPFRGRHQMLAWQGIFSADQREYESRFALTTDTVEDAIHAFLREDEKERHERILHEADSYYLELIHEK
jgi:molybdopterin-guanine dinucleotide biosynthesis protein A